MSTIPDQKATLRIIMLARRKARSDALTPQEQEALNHHIINAVTPLYTPRSVIAGYVPIAGESNVLPAMAGLAGRGAITCLPVMDEATHSLTFRQWKPGDALAPGPRGTQHPKASATPVTPTILLVPLLAFDAQGGRLGMGAGYYDRTLHALRVANPDTKAIGVAFAVQEVEQVPVEETDERLDKIVTE